MQDALYNVTGRLRDNLFSSTHNNVGARGSSSIIADTSPYGRIRDPVSLGNHPSVGVSHSLSRHTITQSTDPLVGVSHGLGRHTPLTQSMDHLGISHGLDRPPSPRLWASQVRSLSLPLSVCRSSHNFATSYGWVWLQSAGGVNLRSNPDVGRGLTSLKGGLELGRSVIPYK